MKHGIPSMRTWIQLNQKYLSGVLLILILLMAASLRFYGLEFQSLWTDELMSLWMSSFDTLTDVMKEGIIPDVHPPAYQLILFWMIKMFGNSETILRIPSAVSGLLAVLGTFLVGKELYTYKEGLLGAAIMAVSWTAVFYSQEARSGMMMVFSTVFATYFWLRILTRLHQKKKVRFTIYLAYFFLAIFSCYVHYFAFAFIAFQGLLSMFLFFGKWLTFRKILLLYGMIIFAYLPWIPSFIYQINNIQGHIAWINDSGINVLINFLYFVYGDSHSILVASLVIICVYLFSPNNSIRDKKKFPISSDILLLMLFVIPVAITFGISISLKPLFIDRYLLFTLPAGYLLLARSILALPLFSWIKGFVSIFLVVFLLYKLIFPLGYYNKVLKEPFRTVAEYITQSQKNNSIVITNVMVPISLDYYFDKLGSKFKEDLRIPGWVGTIYPAEKVSQIISNQNNEYVWYVKQNLNNMSDEQLMDQLVNSIKLVEHKQIIDDYWHYGFEVYLFEVPTSEP